MAVSRALEAITLTEGDNNPQGGDAIGTDLDDYLRNLAVNVGYASKWKEDATISAAATLAAAALHRITPVDPNTTGASVTVTLPAAGGTNIGDGWCTGVRNTTGAKLVIIAGTIDGATNLTLSATNQAVILNSDGTNFFTVAATNKPDDLKFGAFATMSASASAVASTADYLLLLDATDSTIKQQLVTHVVGAGETASTFDGHLDGLTLSNDTDTDHDINVTAGTAADSANAQIMTLASEMTKQIDATWAAGDDAGGLSSSLTAPAADTWYHVHLIVVGGAVDVGFDTSITAANLVTDHSATAYRRIGAVLTDGTTPGNIIQFIQDGDYFAWDVVQEDSTTAWTATRQNFVVSVPLGIKVVANLRTEGDRAGGSWTALMTNPDMTDTAPSSSNGTMGAGNTAATYGNVQMLTDTLSQISIRASATMSNSSVGTIGYWDRRGK